MTTNLDRIHGSYPTNHSPPYITILIRHVYPLLSSCILVLMGYLFLRCLFDVMIDRANLTSPRKAIHESRRELPILSIAIFHRKLLADERVSQLQSSVSYYIPVHSSRHPCLNHLSPHFFHASFKPLLLVKSSLLNQLFAGSIVVQCHLFVGTLW